MGPEALGGGGFVGSERDEDRINAVDVVVVGDVDEGEEVISLINLAIWGSDAVCSTFGCFRLASAEIPCDDDCFAAIAAGSSLTSLYSLDIRDDILARCARSIGDIFIVAAKGCEKLSRAVNDP